VSQPLVTALMVTAGTPQRRKLAQMSLQCFAEQTHYEKRMIIFNHGERINFHHPLVSEHIVQRPPTLGQLRNEIMQFLNPGDWAIAWDDDDWHDPNRIRYQLTNAQMQGKRATALTSYINIDVNTGNCFVRSCKCFRCGACCGTILWQHGSERYPSRDTGEDSDFAMAFKNQGEFVPCESPPTLYIRLCHGENTSGTAKIMEVRKQRRRATKAELGFVRRTLTPYVDKGLFSLATILSSH